MQEPTNPAPDARAQASQPRNPLHGVTLEHIVTTLSAQYGWDDLARRIPVRCFSHDPSIASSLKFLRKTPWARAKVEQLWVATQQARGRELVGRSLARD